MSKLAFRPSTAMGGTGFLDSICPLRLLLAGAFDALEVGHGPAGEDVLDVLGLAAAGARVEGVDQLAAGEQDLAARLFDRPGAQGVLGGHAHIELRARRVDQVVAEVPELVHVLQSVGPGGHGLGLKRLEGVELAGRELSGDDALQIILEVTTLTRTIPLRLPFMIRKPR